MNRLFLIYLLLLFASSCLFSAETDELRIKGAVVKIGSHSNMIVSGSVTELNNSDSGLLKIEENGTLVAEGDIFNLSSSAVQIDGEMFAESNWTNNATASLAHPGSGTGTVEFSGSVNQNIGGSSNTVFENFIINNSAGVTLISNQTISNSLSFSAGIIFTGASRLDVTATNDGMSGYGDGKYVFGNFRRFLTTGIIYHLPIGTAANIELAEIFVSSHTGLNYIDVDFTISDENPVPGGLTVSGVPVDQFLDYGYWTFTPNAGTTAASYHATIHSKGHTDLGGTEDNYSLITDIGSGWQNLGTHSSATQYYSPTIVIAERNYLSDFGNYIIGYSTGVIYNPPVVTDELRIKGSVYKVMANTTSVISNSVVDLNNSDSGLLKIEENGTLVAEGDIFNLSSSAVQIDGELFAESNWTNNATASLAHPGSGIGTIEFSGSVNQNIGGSSNTVFENFIINNSAGVTLTSNQTISNSLSFSAGIIFTGASRLDVTATNDGMSGYGDGKYVFGNFRRYLNTGITYHLPIGTAANFELAEIFVSSHTGLNYIDVDFTISDENPVPGGLTVSGVPVDQFLDYGYWTFTPNAGTTAASYHATIHSKGHTDLGGTEDNYSLITDIGSGWQNLGTHSSATQYYSPTIVIAERNYLSDFGNYIIGYSAGVIYNPPVVTDELRIKGSVYKVMANTTSVISNSIVDLNNSDSGLLKIEENGTLVAEGDIFNLSSSAVQIDGELFAESNWTNNATASLAHPGSGIGTIEFSGSVNQNIGGSSNTVFENFIINNSAGVTLTSNQTISNSLSFSAGIIFTGASRLDVTAANDGMSGFGDGKYVFGNFRRYLTTGIIYHLPIGTAANIELAEIFVSSHTGLNYIDVDFTISDENPVPGGLTVSGVPVDQFLDYGYWTFTPNAGTTAASYHTTIHSKGHTDLGGTEDNYSLITDIGSGWQNLGTHSSATQYYSPTIVIAERNYLSDFGNYIIGYSAGVIYNPPVVTDELRIKGSVYKVMANANSTIIGDMVVTNLVNSGILDIQNLSDFHTESDILNETGSVIKLNGNINIEGDWVNNANVNSTGEIYFQGNTDQTIGGSNQTTYTDFTINKPSGNVTLDINTIVSGTLTLSQGVIITGTDTLICTSTFSSDITGYSDNSFIFGNLRKYITVNTATYPLPVGNGISDTDYHLAEFINNNITGVSSLSASVSNIIESGNNIDANLDPLKAIQDGTELINILEDAEWKIEPLGTVTGGNFGINLYVDNISNFSSADDYEFCILKRASASTNYSDWDAFSATTTIPNDGLGGRTYITYDGGGFPVGPGFAQRTGYTSFSKFVIAKSDNIPLPVELLSFTGQLINDIVELNWITLTEINNDYFTIERAQWNEELNLLSWEYLLSLPGSGNSNYRIEYHSADENPYSSISYYRLKQTDFDGNFTYSNIIQINNPRKTIEGAYGLDFVAYPNPSYNEKINIINTRKYYPNQELTFEVLNMLGQVVIIKEIITDDSGAFLFTINDEDRLPSGVYIARISEFLPDGKSLNSFSNKLIIK